jgi:hypothetical protein
MFPSFQGGFILTLHAQNVPTDFPGISERWFIAHVVLVVPMQPLVLLFAVVRRCATQLATAVPCFTLLCCYLSRTQEGRDDKSFSTLFQM